MLSVTACLMLSGMMQTLRLSGSSGSFPKPLGEKEEAYYLEKASKGDLEARNILIERNLRLVAHIMKKYYSSTADQEDLISIGTIGLIKGISTFDGSKGARLATYAARCVENEILMHFRSQKKTSGDISLSECLETGKDGNALSLLEVISGSDDLFENLSNREIYGQLYDTIVRVMTPREKTILTLRYGLGNTQPRPQREIAKLLGISRSYVSRIEKKALEKLRCEMEHIGR